MDGYSWSMVLANTLSIWLRIMKVHLLAVGRKMPDWVTTGFDEYARRMPPDMSLILKEIAPEKRPSKYNADHIAQLESERLIEATPKDAYIIALDERGDLLSSRQLAEQMRGWRRLGRDVALWVGGADGLAASARSRTDRMWSLSPLTFPHTVVRILVAEQLYRAYSILSGHPYHRD